MGRLLLDGGEEVDVDEMQVGEMLIDKGIEVDATRGVGRDEGLGEKVQERAQPDPRQAVPPPSPTQPQPAPRLVHIWQFAHFPQLHICNLHPIYIQPPPLFSFSPLFLTQHLLFSQKLTVLGNLLSRCPE